jgi:hypothetical protein
MAGVPTSGELAIVIEMPETAGGDLPKQAPSPASPQDEGQATTNPVEGNKNGQVKLAMALSTAKNIGMQGLNAAVSNIGLATGNYQAQRGVEKAMQTGTSLLGLAASFTNPFTAVAAVAGLAIQTGSEIYKQNKEREFANYEAEQYAKRLGFTVDRR